MTAFMPKPLLIIFTARPAPESLPENKPPLQQTRRRPLHCINSSFQQLYDQYKADVKPEEIINPKVMKEKKKLEKAERNTYKNEQQLAFYNPNSNTKATKNPYKTIFVARLNYKTTEEDLKQFFSEYGEIAKVMLIRNKLTNVSRGYAFIEFKHEKDMKFCYKKANRSVIDGYKIKVDVERGRTVTGFRPLRLGKGLGHSRK
ncbi:MAG: U1 small nuclear ribonucleoprotein 70 kDa [Marteilia pararefringens]